MSDHALLLSNLGSPRSTSVSDVRSYLNQFLMDPYVIDIPWPLRRLLVGIILAVRPAKSAAAYASIWWPEGSPLVVISEQLTDKVRPLWQHGPTLLAMRYGEPSISSRLLELEKQGIKKVTFAPLYPQFADSTTTTAIKEAEKCIKKHNLSLKLNIVQPFYADPLYIHALVKSAEKELQQDFDHLLLSFHGLPESHLKKLDPTGSHCLKDKSCCETASQAVLDTCYRAQCMRSAELFAQASGLRKEQWSVAFQSRLGKNKWIEPYTDATLEELAARGVKKLLVMSPAFVADCIETLEELGIEGREDFIAAGGEELVLIPCLNSQEHWAQALTQICENATA
ncbi:MAG TPA: ferrochelatase [Thiopseudomonas sp.]|nr:ferrochelatase [Thiopseudomonas sp.]